MDRRTFLKSIFASAIATQLPDVAAALRDKVSERAASAVRVTDYSPHSIELTYTSPSRKMIMGADGIWRYSPVTVEHVRRIDETIWEVRVTSAGMSEDTGVSISLATGDPDGVFIGDEESLREYLLKHPDRIGAKDISVGQRSDMTFWMMT